MNNKINNEYFRGIAACIVFGLLIIGGRLHSLVCQGRLRLIWYQIGTILRGMGLIFGVGIGLTVPCVAYGVASLENNSHIWALLAVVCKKKKKKTEKNGKRKERKKF